MGLEEHITPQRIAASIILNAREYDSFVVVEGKTDCAVFKKFINKKSVKLEIAFGHENVIKVMEELKKQSFNGAIGIIDSDFHRLDNDFLDNQSVVLTDYHDIEIMLINSNSFDSVLENYVQSEKLEEKYGNLDGYRQHIYDVTKHLGYLKWYSHKNNIGLVFKPSTPDGKQIDYSKFVSVETLDFLGYDKLIDCIYNYCHGKNKILISKDELKKQLVEFIKDCDLCHLCNGHDLVHIISLSLRKNISNLNSRAVSADQIAKELILAYEARYFETTSLYSAIKSWEATTGLPVLDF